MDQQESEKGRICRGAVVDEEVNSERTFYQNRYEHATSLFKQGMWPGFSGMDRITRRGSHQSTTLATFTSLAPLHQQGTALLVLIWSLAI